MTRNGMCSESWGGVGEKQGFGVVPFLLYGCCPVSPQAASLHYLPGGFNLKTFTRPLKTRLPRPDFSTELIEDKKL